jgi:hypothetical protein
MLLSMHNDEAGVVAVLGVFVMVITIVSIGTRYKFRCERLRTIQRVLESGALDEATRRAMLDALAPGTGRATLPGALRNLGLLAWRLLFVAGWLTMMIGAIYWISAGVFEWRRDDVEGGAIATGIGFALVTLPIALRELEARRSPARS